MASHFRLVLRVAAMAATWQCVSAGPHESLLQSFSIPSPNVDCGGHYAETCDVCSQGHGHLWCHGDCTYLFSHCEYTTPWVLFKKFISDLVDLAFTLMFMWFYYTPCIICSAAIMGCYAAVYKGRVVEEFPEEGHIEERPPDYDEWEERTIGPFIVFKAPNACLWATFCTPVLAAKNFHVGKAFAYWPSCIIMFLMYTPLCCIAVLMRSIMSGKLQRNLKHRTSFCSECVSSLFCMCCAVGRESLEVDEAEYKEVRCPFNVESTWEGFFEEPVGDHHTSLKDRICGGDWHRRGAHNEDTRMCGFAS